MQCVNFSLPENQELVEGLKEYFEQQSGESQQQYEERIKGMATIAVNLNGGHPLQFAPNGKFSLLYNDLYAAHLNKAVSDVTTASQSNIEELAKKARYYALATKASLLLSKEKKKLYKHAVDENKEPVLWQIYTPDEQGRKIYRYGYATKKFKFQELKELRTEDVGTAEILDKLNKYIDPKTRQVRGEPGTKQHKENVELLLQLRDHIRLVYEEKGKERELVNPSHYMKVPYRVRIVPTRGAILSGMRRAKVVPPWIEPHIVVDLEDKKLPFIPSVAHSVLNMYISSVNYFNGQYTIGNRRVKDITLETDKNYFDYLKQRELASENKEDYYTARALMDISTRVAFYLFVKESYPDINSHIGTSEELLDELLERYELKDKINDRQKEALLEGTIPHLLDIIRSEIEFPESASVYAKVPVVTNKGIIVADAIMLSEEVGEEGVSIIDAVSIPRRGAGEVRTKAIQEKHKIIKRFLESGNKYYSIPGMYNAVKLSRTLYIRVSKIRSGENSGQMVLGDEPVETDVRTMVPEEVTKTLSTTMNYLQAALKAIEHEINSTTDKTIKEQLRVVQRQLLKIFHSTMAVNFDHTIIASAASDMNYASSVIKTFLGLPDRVVQPAAASLMRMLKAMEYAVNEIEDYAKRLKEDMGDYAVLMEEEWDRRFRQLRTARGNIEQTANILKGKVDKWIVETAREAEIDSDKLDEQPIVTGRLLQTIGIASLEHPVVQTLVKAITVESKKIEIKLRTKFRKLRAASDKIASVLDKRTLQLSKITKLSRTGFFDPILQKWKNGKRTGSLIRPYLPEYYKERSAALERNDIEWFKNNTVFDQEAYNKALEEQKEMLEELFPVYREKAKVILEKDKEFHNQDRALQEKRIAELATKLLENELEVWIEENENNLVRFGKPVENPEDVKPGQEYWVDPRYKEMMESDDELMQAYREFYIIYNEIIEYIEEVTGYPLYEGFIPDFDAGLIERLTGFRFPHIGFSLAKFFIPDSIYSEEAVRDPITGKYLREIPINGIHNSVYLKRRKGFAHKHKSYDLEKVLYLFAYSSAQYATSRKYLGMFFKALEDIRQGYAVQRDLMGNPIVDEEGKSRATAKDVRGENVLLHYIMNRIYRNAEGDSRERGNIIRVTGRVIKHLIGLEGDDVEVFFKFARLLDMVKGYLVLRVMAENVLAALVDLVSSMFFIAKKGGFAKITAAELGKGFRNTLLLAIAAHDIPLKILPENISKHLRLLREIMYAVPDPTMRKTEQAKAAHYSSLPGSGVTINRILYYPWEASDLLKQRALFLTMLFSRKYRVSIDNFVMEDGELMYVIDRKKGENGKEILETVPIDDPKAAKELAIFSSQVLSASKNILGNYDPEDTPIQNRYGLLRIVFALRGYLPVLITSIAGPKRYDYFLSHSDKGWARSVIQLIWHSGKTFFKYGPVTMFRAAAHDIGIKFFRHTPTFTTGIEGADKRNLYVKSFVVTQIALALLYIFRGWLRSKLPPKEDVRSWLEKHNLDRKVLRWTLTALNRILSEQYFGVSPDVKIITEPTLLANSAEETFDLFKHSYYLLSGEYMKMPKPYPLTAEDYSSGGSLYREATEVEAEQRKKILKLLIKYDLMKAVPVLNMLIKYKTINRGYSPMYDEYYILKGTGDIPAYYEQYLTKKKYRGSAVYKVDWWYNE